MADKTPVPGLGRGVYGLVELKSKDPRGLVHLRGQVSRMPKDVP